MPIFPPVLVGLFSEDLTGYSYFGKLSSYLGGLGLSYFLWVLEMVVGFEIDLGVISVSYHF